MLANVGNYSAINLVVDVRTVLGNLLEDYFKASNNGAAWRILHTTAATIFNAGRGHHNEGGKWWKEDFSNKWIDITIKFC